MGGQRAELMGYSHKISTQKRELDNSSQPHRIKSKRQPAREKTPQLKRKSCLLLLQVMLADGIC
jgi:hypothetical protein